AQCASRRAGAVPRSTPLHPGAAERLSRSRIMNSIRTVGGLSLAALMTLCVPAFTPDVAQAQIKFSVTSSLGGPSDGQVSKRSVERYADVLGFSPEQKESALTIHEGYAAAYQQAQKARRTSMEDVRRSSEDTGDH